MAPMVSQSDAPFRWLARKYGCDLCFTQMMHAKNIVRDITFRKAHLDIYQDGELVRELSPSQQRCLGTIQNWKPFIWNEGGPLIVQLAGHDATTMVEAARIIRDEHDPSSIAGFDVNLGCPQGIARKGNYGAFLMEQDEQSVYDILRSLRQSVPSSLTVSAKIRIPLDPSQFQDRLLKLQATGIDFLTIHGRTLEENKTRTGPSRTNLIAEAVQLLQTTGCSVIANGGVETYQDAQRLLEATRAHAIMSSEALLEDPTLFSNHGHKKHLQVAHEYLDLCEIYPPVPGSLGAVGGSFNVVRAHLFKMLHRYLHDLPDLRKKLSDIKTVSIPQAREILHAIEDQQQHLTHDDHNYNPDSSWYRRHWNTAVQAKNVKVRGDDYFRQAQPQLSIQERKQQAKERISKLRKARMLNKKAPMA